MRAAVIGLGEIAHKAYLPLLAQRDGVELLLLSRSAAGVERARARYPSARATTAWEELLGWGPQAAFVLTPSPTHHAVALRLLEAGVDVLVEKPPTLHSSQTRALAERARGLGRVLMAGFNRRYAPLHRRARELWGERRTGLCLLEKHRATAAHAGLSANFVEDTIHLVDLLRFFCGEARALHTSQRLRDGRLVDAVALAALAGGGQAVIATSLEAGRWSERCALHGEAASLQLDAFSRLRLVGPGEERLWREEPGAGWASPLAARGFPQQIAHFLECVRSRAEPLTSAWDAVLTQLLLEDLVARAAAS